MADKIRWGILGAGNIARKFATGMKVVAGSELLAVGSRSIERAQSFAKEFNIPKTYGSYEEMVKDPELDVVYIATPHTFHKPHALLCLNNGKAVLCEKPFGVNAGEVEEMVQCARKNNLFLMEAMWTRFLPVMYKVKEWITNEAIGEVRMLTADFGFYASINPEGRLFNLQLGGGALLDVGVYPINLASMIFGGAPERITGMAHIGETGVDEQAAMILGYKNGELAILHTAIRANTHHEARIIGTKGSIIIPDFWRATSATFKIDSKDEEIVEIPFEANGYCYEAREVERCLKEGKLESDLMTWDESISILKTMDELRKQWGLRYPVDTI
ncbi:MAG: Gfo/Idh/MocA family oxidoreductase [Clostridiaceae bacterium]|nr:Gfo/Idh/MocA family oxidoreductase [Clostridiaceae bacterium]